MSGFERLPGGGYRLPPITVFGTLPRPPLSTPIRQPPPTPYQPPRTPVFGPVPGMPGSSFRDQDAARRQAETARERARLEAERLRQEAARRAQEQRDAQRRQAEADRIRRLQDQSRQQELERQRQFQAARDAERRRQEADRQQRMRDQQRRDDEQRRLRADIEARRQRSSELAPSGLAGVFRRVFGRRPAPASGRPAVTSSAETRAEARVAAHEAALRASAAAEEREALADARPIGKLVPLLSDTVRDGVPLDFLLGWIDKESSGHVGSDESARQAGNPAYTLDEVGLFQISAEERSLYLKLRPADRARILTDAAYSLKQGVRLAKYYQQAIESAHGVTTTSPAVWELVKLAHKVGLPSVQRLLRTMQAESIDPASASWRDVKKFAAAHPGAGATLSQMSRVDVVVLRGKALAAALSAPQ